MRVRINGEERQVADHLNIAQLLEQLGLGQRKLAVEINRQIIPASAYAQVTLSEHDIIEIIHAVGGG